MNKKEKTFVIVSDSRSVIVPMFAFDTLDEALLFIENDFQEKREKLGLESITSAFNDEDGFAYIETCDGIGQKESIEWNIPVLQNKYWR